MIFLIGINSTYYAIESTTAPSAISRLRELRLIGDEQPSLIQGGDVIEINEATGKISSYNITASERTDP